MKLTNSEKHKNYTVGLDIGTTSVGWSVQDQNNNVLKYKGKKMWGVRLFDEGEIAESRRIFRSNRRRLARRKYRISLLKGLLEPEIMKVDPTFFLRLEESFAVPEDKSSKSTYNLFIDENFNDQSFYKLYPTIYHLRRHLIYNEVSDIRLIYLALHHIIKYRGNFLFEHQDFDVENIDLIRSLNTVFNQMEEFLDLNKLSNSMLEEVSSILTNKSLNKTEKCEEIEDELKELFLNKKQMQVFTRLITGRESNLNNFFELEDLDKTQKDLLKINFSKEKYEENKDTIFEILGEQAEIIEQTKELYNVIFLADMFKDVDNPYISEVMIKKYNKHAEDLRRLKKLLKENYSRDDYYNFFKDKEVGFNYESYLKRPSEMKKKLSLKDTYLDFIKRIEKLILSKSIADNEDYQYCLKEIEDGSFLEKLNTTENGNYPYQVHRIELELILEKQGKKFPVLLERDKNGKNKIVSLLEFRIPYYVGPLNDYHKKKDGYFSWVKRKESGQVTPWNFDDKIDVIGSAEKFITSMTSYCTYFVNEKVIPKNSLLYTKYMVLSEIKQIKVNNHFLSPTLYQDLLNEFIYGNKVNISKKDLENWLKKQGVFPGEELSLTGFQKENGFATNMKPYRDFLKIFDNIEDNYDTIEKLIEWITLFEDKKILKQRIEDFYPELDDETVKKIIKLNYSGWSRLSTKFLTSRYLNDKGYKKSMMEMLMSERLNMMQIMKKEEYGFDKALKLENFGTDELEDIEYDDIFKLAGSPALKKGIWQSIQIVKEIVSLTKENPKNIFIEMARSDEKSQRTKSRKEQLLDLYKKLDTTFPGYKDLMKQLRNSDEKSFNRKYYLYYMQLGKCLYSGNSINISELNTDLYEIDHIIPRHLIKDDSFDNLALVTRKSNQEKGDNLTLSGEVINQRRTFWDSLLKNGLMSSKKYYNLTRKHFKESDIEGFINRQLVETRQIIKHVVNLLDKYYGEGTVGGVKAKLISDFRNKYNIYKVRNLNNYHHAIDAYLCSVIGNYTITKYPKLKREIIYNDFFNIKMSYNERRKSKYGFILDSLDQEEYINQETGEIINMKNWLNNVIRHCNYQDILITKKIEMNTGEFYNQTIMSPRSNIKELIPLKEDRDPKKYGGYTGEQIAYSVLVDYQKGKKRDRTIIGVPIRIAISNKKETLLEDYLNKQLKTSDYIILKDKIMKNQLIFFKGQLCYLSSSSEVVNAVELHVNMKQKEAIFKILNHKNYNWEEENLLEVKNLFVEVVEKSLLKYPLLNSELKLISKYVKFDYFENLELNELEKFVTEFLKLVSASPTNANFTEFKNDEFKFTARMGRRSQQNVSSGKLIYSSITGLRRKTYEF